jgi:RimJ/RimL family protein N-acetyltransferase
LLRFDGIASAEAEISVYLLPEFVGRGAGTAAIQGGCELLSRETKVVRVMAWVREENVRSRNAFVKAGFRAATAKRADHVGFVRELTDLAAVRGHGAGDRT